jgi:acetyl esterase/lipase
VLLVLLSLTLLLPGSCAGGSSDKASAGPVSHEYLPGLEAYPHLPKDVTSAPVVVLVPGGGWVSADPSGLGGLAEALAGAGIVAVPVTIRAQEDGVVYPVPVEDVLCALGDAAATARAAGIEPTALVLLGHSSGAHLSALATLAPDSVQPKCEDPAVEPDALVGLAGPYDIRSFGDNAEVLLGVPQQEDPERWAEANPVLLADHRPDVPVLLVHGEADEVVPPSATTEFGDALRRGGHDTTVQMLPGVDHSAVYTAPVVGRQVASWVAALAHQ